MSDRKCIECGEITENPSLCAKCMGKAQKKGERARAAARTPVKQRNTNE